MVCSRSWHLPGNPTLVWHAARLIKERGYLDLSMYTMHLKDPLVLIGSEGSALTLHFSRLSPRIIRTCHCFSTMTMDHFVLISYGTKWPLCVDVPLNTHYFIHLFEKILLSICSMEMNLFPGSISYAEQGILTLYARISLSSSVEHAVFASLQRSKQSHRCSEYCLLP